MSVYLEVGFRVHNEFHTYKFVEDKFQLLLLIPKIADNIKPCSLFYTNLPITSSLCLKGKH